MFPGPTTTISITAALYYGCAIADADGISNTSTINDVIGQDDSDAKPGDNNAECGGGGGGDEDDDYADADANADADAEDEEGEEKMTKTMIALLLLLLLLV
jgi:hypothetical protein